jgi:hypothetical protein
MKKITITFIVLYSLLSIFSLPFNSLHGQNRENHPSPTNLRYPGLNASQVTESPVFAWQEASGNPSGYKFYLGSDGQGQTSPSNLVNGVDLGNVLSFYSDINLELNQTYYWQVIPYHVDNGDALNCPIWSFQTKSSASDSIPYRNFINDINGFTGNILMANDQGIQNSSGIVTSALSGSFQTSNAIGANSSSSQVVFYYRLSDFQLGDSASQDPSFLTSYISYDNINFQEINLLSCYDDNLNDQYNKVTIDLANYPGTFYVKFTYNLYHFYYSFFGTSNNPKLYLDNFFIRENISQPHLNVSPETWDIENGLINLTYNQDVVITNYSTYELSIENLAIAVNPISPNNFFLNSSQSDITLPEGYSYSFSIDFYANEYGYMNSAVTYEFSEEGGISPGDPTQILMTLSADCPNPHISSFPYQQDFSQWPPFGWNYGTWEQYIDVDETTWAVCQETPASTITMGFASPSFYSTLPLNLQFKLLVPNNVNFNITFSIDIAEYNPTPSSIDWNTFYTFSCQDNITYVYEQGVLINKYVIKNMHIPEEYIGLPFIIRFSTSFFSENAPRITDFTIYTSPQDVYVNLANPQLSISRENSHNVLRWEHIPYADDYEIQATNNLRTSNWETLSNTPYQAYVYDGDEVFKFFRIKVLSNTLP